MAYYGSWKIDDLLTFAANTHNVSTGAATDADAVPAYRVYEDETGTAILTGNMAKLDDAGTVGFYSEQITLSAANGFEKGKAYTVYISAAVSSVMGTMHHNFQIEAEVDANVVSAANVSANVDQWLGTTAQGASGRPQVDLELWLGVAPNALTSGRVECLVGAMAGGSITSTALGASAVDEIVDAVWDEDATAHQTTGTFGQAIGDPVADTNTIYAAVVTNAAGATIAADIVSVQADTDDIQTRLPAALVGGRIDASVGAMAANTLTASALAADAVDEILDDVVEGTTTFRQMLRLFASALGSKLSGAGTGTEVFRDIGDTKDRITATVDASGNRTAITLDLT